MLTPLERPQAVYWQNEPASSLAEDLNTDNHVAEIFEAIGETQFRIQPVTHGLGNYSDFGESKLIRGGFCVDGEVGFLIQASDRIYGVLNVGIVSFNLSKQDYAEGIIDEEGSYPRIVQLQGCTSSADSTERNRRVWRVLNTFPLEKGEVSLVEYFARSQNHEMTGILPVEAVPARTHQGFSMERGRIRYDGTAQTLGYRRQNQGLYLKTL